MNERELRLLFSIREILRAIQQSLRLLVEQNAGKQEQAPYPVEIRSEIQLPPAITAHYAGEERERPQKNSRDRQRLLLSWIGTLTAILAAGFTLVTLSQVIRQANAAREQVEIMRKQFEAADRPWISVSISASGPLTYDSSGAHVLFTIEPTNIGRSPAQNTRISIRLVPGIMGTDITDAQRRICKQAESSVLPRYVLFPGNSYRQPMGTELSSADMNAHWTDFELRQGVDLVPIILIGCVDYTYSSSTAKHHTGFAYDVLMSDGRIVLKSKTPLAPGSIALTQHPTGGFFTD